MHETRREMDFSDVKVTATTKNYGKRPGRKAIEIENSITLEIHENILQNQSN